MRRWTGWYALWLNYRTHRLQMARHRYPKHMGRWTRFRLNLLTEDAGLIREHAFHRRSPAPCGHSCHKHRPCDTCWYPRPGWTIRTVRNAGRTR